ncbi:MAG TPA: ABC transporter ATP-binding protein [Chloroflexota bacterium]|nr:ABC transporter ATP-binding protein [Chloroflexota bacterium]
MIDVQQLTKDYGPHRAISDVTFSVERGEVLGFLGPNGAGKTTTMRILTGYMPATSGTVTIAGFDIFKQSVEARQRVGYLPETVPLYPEMSVSGYLDFMAKLKGIPRRDRKSEIERVMRATGVVERAEQLIAKLSKGFRQRVGVAQALLGSPDVLVLDEPTIGLDPRQIIEVRNLIKSFGGEHTVILSTHILPEVSMTCSRVIIINDGRLVAVDTPENLTRRLRGAEAIQVEVRGPRAAVIKQLKQVPKVTGVTVASDGREGEVATYNVAGELGADVREALAAAVVNGGFGLLELHQAGMSLEDIFLRLTTEEASVATEGAAA